ncbi:NAD(P)-dependent oxidoreductase [Caulobacter sp. KR2-114]|uniref:NAD(P)-dependent oxidoreductase n=1 Tax=Caulobacter sp. KR2-114 TaxID=3400912 RepID=UPI003BFB36D9
MAEAIGFLGAGLLGSKVVENLLQSGHGVRLHNRTRANAEPLLAKGAAWAPTAADAAEPGGVVMSLLWDDASVEATVASEGFLTRLGPGGLHISMSTITPEASQRLAARHAAAGCVYVEAPVFGRPEQAAARQLTAALAGPDAGRARALPLLEAGGAARVFEFGEAVGAAAMVKLVGNFLLISAASSLTEALGAARAKGFDAQAILDMLTATLFPSPIYQAYGQVIAAGGAGMGGSPIPAKDLGLFEQTAAAGGVEAPIAHMLRGLRG